MKSILQRLMPFIIFGISIFIFVIGIILFSYVLIFGALIGLILFGIQWIRDKLSASRTKAPDKVERKGRVIDHDDIK